MAVKIDPPDGLAEDQRQVFSALSTLVHNPRIADRAYDALPESHQGRVISVDLARHLSPVFATWDGRIRHTQSTGAPAGAYAHSRLIRELQRPSRSGRKLLITAGGAGSGKTTMLKDVFSAEPRVDLVFDNQLRSQRRASEIVTLALQGGWHVDVVFVFRPFGDAVRAVAERSQRTGRWNVIHDIPDMHLSARQTFLNLHHTFAPHAGFHVVFNASESVRVNASTSHMPRGVATIPIEHLEKLGEYDLPHGTQATQTIHRVLKECLSQGLLCEPVFDLITQKGSHLSRIG